MREEVEAGGVEGEGGGLREGTYERTSTEQIPGPRSCLVSATDGNILGVKRWGEGGGG